MSILDLLQSQLVDQTAGTVGKQLGISEDMAKTAMAAAVPLLIGALSRNASKSGGADSLAGALERDHDGSVLDDVTGFLGGGRAETEGQGILGHILGGRQEKAAAGVGRASGIDSGQAGQLMAMMAPMVMGALGKEKRRSGMDAQGLAGMLQQEDRKFESAGAGALLANMLDQDGDGDADLGDLAKGLLGGMFKKP